MPILLQACSQNENMKWTSNPAYTKRDGERGGAERGEGAKGRGEHSGQGGGGEG